MELFEQATFTGASLYDVPDFYELDYATYRAEEAFYQLLVDQYIQPGLAYVELGAGTGRLLLPYAAQGVRCHGVDPAPPMLARLAGKAVGRGVDPKNISTEVADAQTFRGPTDAPANLITFPFNGLLHIYGHDAFDEVLAQVKRRLAPGGCFALDITSPAWEEIAMGGRPLGRLDERTHPQTGARIMTCDQCDYDTAARTMHTDFLFLDEGSTQGTRTQIKQFMWTFQEVLHRLGLHGFVVDLIFGDVDFSPYTESSPRLLVSATLG